MSIIIFVLAFVAGYIVSSRGIGSWLYSATLKPFVDKWFGPQS